MNEVFSSRIRELRNKTGLTQKQFAEKAQISVSAYATYEQGAKMPPLEIAAKIADVFGVSLDWLCGRLKDDESFQFDNYGDMARAFIRLADAGFYVEIGEERMPADKDPGIDHEELELYLNPQGGYSDTQRAVMKVLSWRFGSFFAGWAKIRKLYLDGDLDREMYNAWLDKKVEEFSKIPLENS